MNWPHAPVHWLFEPGLYIVTTGTYQKLPHLHSPERLDYFLESLFGCAKGIRLGFARLGGTGKSLPLVAGSPTDPGTLPKFLGKLHMQTAKQPLS